MVLFGQHGFRATTVRAIAESASVSPALVLHHFSSKQGLRDAINDALANQIREGEFAMMTGSMSVNQEAYEEMAAEYSDALPYLARALAEGDELGRGLFDRLFADAVDYMQAGVEAGVLSPTEHPKARAAALLSASLGVLVMQDHVQRVLGAADDMEMLRQVAPAMLELYTHGLFADASILEGWTPDEHHGARIADSDPPPDATDITDDGHLE